MTVVLVLALLCLGYLVLKQWLLLVDERALRENAVARGWLLLETAVAACASAEDMEQAASKPGWATERTGPPYRDSLLNEELPLALRVWIEPPIPFGKLDHDLFQFDERG